MPDLTSVINRALDSMDQVRERVLELLTLCHEIEGTEAIKDAINAAATPLVNANTALEDILSAIEDRS